MSDTPILIAQNVRKTYIMGERKLEVLRGVSLTVRAGEMVALVGENGSGKTTLVKLLCRLYDPTEGNVTVDGEDLRLFDPASLRRQIGVVFEDAFLFSVSQLLTASSVASPQTDPIKVLELLFDIYAITVVAALAGSFGAFFHRRNQEQDAAKAAAAAESQGQ